MVTPKADRVDIADQSFMIANALRDCPAHMVIRELLQNAIEATGSQGKIEWFITTWEGTRKLGLYNEGVGMTSSELNTLMGSVASSGKEMAFDKNFGMGAKMSAAKASPYGLVYRSCKDGRVSQIWLKMQDRSHGGKELVKQPQYDPYEGDYTNVLDVTEQSLAQGRTIDNEWTEAILLGHTAQDDTVTGAFLGATAPQRERGNGIVDNWLIRLINQRFYCMPTGVRVGRVSVTVPSNETLDRLATGLGDVLLRDTYTARHEAITAQSSIGPLTLIYGRLVGEAKDRKSAGGGWYASGLPKPSHVCLVWRNEVYDLDTQWGLRSGAYGMHSVNEDYYVHILLPDTAPIRNNFHRTLIEMDDETAQPLTCQELSPFVLQNRPAWVLEEIHKRVHVETSGHVKDRMAKIAKELHAYAPMPVVTPGEGMDPGVIELEKGDHESGLNGSRHPIEPKPHGRFTQPGMGQRTPRPRPETLQVLFKSIDFEPQWHEDHAGKAGQYDPSINVLYLNKEFVEYAKLEAWVKQEWGYDDWFAATQQLDEEYCVRAYLFGASALHFRGQEHWTPEEYLKALSPEAISSAILDPLRTMQIAIKHIMNRRLNSGIRDEAGGLVYAK